MRRLPAFALCSAALLILAGCGEAAGARPATDPDRTGGKLPTATPTGSRPCPTAVQWDTGESSPMPPTSPRVEALSSALASLGRDGTFAGVYGTVILNSPPGRVVLCVTDPDAGRRMGRAAKAADPRIDLTLLDVDRCRYTERTLEAAVDRIDPGLGGYHLYDWGPASDHSGIEMTADKRAAHSKALHAQLVAVTGGIPVHVTEGRQAHLD